MHTKLYINRVMLLRRKNVSSQSCHLSSYWSPHSADAWSRSELEPRTVCSNPRHLRWSVGAPCVYRTVLPLAYTRRATMDHISSMVLKLGDRASQSIPVNPNREKTPSSHKKCGLEHSLSGRKTMCHTLGGRRGLETPQWYRHSGKRFDGTQVSPACSSPPN